MSKITCDFNFVMDSKLSCGLSKEALKSYKERAKMGTEKLTHLVSQGLVGFPNLTSFDTSVIKNFTKDKKNNFNDLILIGIGGSALGIEAITNALLPYGYNAMSYVDRGYLPRVWIADNVDPFKIKSILKMCDPEDTIAVVISKSGSTVETIENYSLIKEWFKSKIKDLKKHIVIVTDPKTGPLREYAEKNDITAFDIDSSVGGRFSVLSPVGLLPASFLGINIDKLLEGAAVISQEYQEQILTLSAIYLYFMEHGKSVNVLMPYSSRLEKFAEWFCQLWGESLGKIYLLDDKTANFGTTPVRTIGAIDQHSQVQLYKEGPKDKLITFLSVASHSNDSAVKSDYHEAFNYLEGIQLGRLLNTELMATEASLLTSNVPSMKLSINTIDEYSLGQLFMLFQYIVPIIGLAGGIDPFNQPGVEEGKVYAYGLMGRKGFEDKKAYFESIYKKDDEFII